MMGRDELANRLARPVANRAPSPSRAAQLRDQERRTFRTSAVAIGVALASQVSK